MAKSDDSEESAEARLLRVSADLGNAANQLYDLVAAISKSMNLPKPPKLGDDSNDA